MPVNFFDSALIRHTLLKSQRSLNPPGQFVLRQCQQCAARRQASSGCAKKQSDKDARTKAGGPKSESLHGSQKRELCEQPFSSKRRKCQSELAIGSNGWMLKVLPARLSTRSKTIF